jgi:enolase-phosphatase E1
MNETEVRAILLDIEGTTTPVEFVYEVLFPYARDHVKEFIERRRDEEAVQADVAGLRDVHAADIRKGLEPPAWNDETEASQLESIVAYVHWLIAQDRKATALKSLQGKIWEAGYRAGTLRSEIYPDVPPALVRWHSQQRPVSIFSSGSVLAQKLLFAHTTAGDLTGLIHAYFDTTTGAKAEAESYRRIVAALKLSPSEVLFLSDVAAELAAAQAAGMQTALCVRPGRPEPATSEYRIIHTFDEVFP